MPARRPVPAQQKSTIQRLCACRPAQRKLVLGVGRRDRDEARAREERRDRVREEDLGDDAVGVEVAEPLVAVPVLRALRVVALQVGERVVVRREPAVVLVVVTRVEVLLVRLDVGAAWPSDEMMV
jgi:hypothetical protein